MAKFNFGHLVPGFIQLELRMVTFEKVTVVGETDKNMPKIIYLTRATSKCEFKATPLFAEIR